MGDGRRPGTDTVGLDGWANSAQGLLLVLVLVCRSADHRAGNSPLVIRLCGGEIPGVRDSGAAETQRPVFHGSTWIFAPDTSGRNWRHTPAGSCSKPLPTRARTPGGPRGCRTGHLPGLGRHTDGEPGHTSPRPGVLPQCVRHATNPD